MITSNAEQPRNVEYSCNIEDNRRDRNNITEFTEMVKTSSRRFLRLLLQTYEKDRQKVIEDSERKQTELNNRIKLLECAIDNEK